MTNYLACKVSRCSKLTGLFTNTSPTRDESRALLLVKQGFCRRRRHFPSLDMTCNVKAFLFFADRVPNFHEIAEVRTRRSGHSRTRGRCPWSLPRLSRRFRPCETAKELGRAIHPKYERLHSLPAVPPVTSTVCETTMGWMRNESLDNTLPRMSAGIVL